ncbi:MAG: hypothetical protein ACM3XM_05865 [Mycobacterium leprae]
MKFMLDTNVFDRILGTPGMVSLLNTLSKAGAITLLTTPVQEAELQAMPDARRRRVAQSILRQVVPADDGLDMAAPPGAVDPRTLMPSPKHLRDALIGAAASWQVDVLVTEDRRFAKRVREAHANCRVIGFAEFRSMVMASDP